MGRPNQSNVITQLSTSGVGWLGQRVENLKGASGELVKRLAQVF